MPVLSAYLGHVSPAGTYWYLTAVPELMELAAARLDRHPGQRDDRARTDLAGVLHRPARRPARRQPEHHRRLPRHLPAAARPSPPSGPARTPCQLDIADLDAPLVAAFLDHLEHVPWQQPATRNNRLAAIHSLFACAALRHPEHAASIQRVLAIPPKRFQRNLVTYLTERRGRRAGGGVRQADLDRPPRSRPARARRPGRAADLRTGRPHHRRHRPQRRSARAHHRERTQGTAHPAAPRHRRRAAGLDRRTARRARRPAVPRQHRPHAQPRRDRAAHQPSTSPKRRRPARPCRPSTSPPTRSGTAAR